MAANPEILDDVERKRIYMREYRKRNAGKIRERKREYYHENLEQSREANRQNYQRHAETRKSGVKRYIAENRDAHGAWAKKWRRENPDKVRAYVINRRAKLASSGGGITGADIGVITKRQRGRCAACRRKVALAMDHIMPLALGGENSARNIQGLCQPCNSAKHAKHPADFNRSLGLLV